MEQHSDALINQRKATKAPADYPRKEELDNYKLANEWDMNRKGALCLEIKQDNFVLMGGNDGQVVLMDVAKQEPRRYNPF